MGPIFVPHTHPRVTSDTPRARQRTAWLASLEPDMRRLATQYFSANPGGTEVTLAVLDGLGQQRLAQLAKSAGRSMDTVKKDFGLFMVLVLIDIYGPARVETLRHATSGKNSTRSRTAHWPNLSWVARYTPHRIREESPIAAPDPKDDEGGFKPRSYLAVNREERFFCFLVAHALLAHREARVAFAEMVTAAHPRCHLEPDDLQVFVEAAVLRDFWNDLGDPQAYDEDTARRRRQVIDELLRQQGASITVDEDALFWTSKERRKLWNPGRWPTAMLRERGLDRLLSLKWAFNAKPDFVLVSPGHALMIEAKLESDIGQSEGYHQLETQRLIATLLPQFVPAFEGVRVETTTLGVNVEDGLNWSDAVRALDVEGLDAFTRAGLARAVELGGRIGPN